MRFLFINVDCGIGSTGRICSDLARELIKKGDEAVVAYGRGCLKNDFDISHRVGGRMNVLLHVIHSRVFDRSGFASTIATKKFIKWVEKYNPDVIHLHNIHGYWINVRVLFEYLKECGKKVFWTLHDCWPFTGHCAHFDYFLCNKWKTMCCNCGQLKEYPKSCLFDSSTRNYNEKKKLFCGVPNMTIITPSNWLAELVKQSFLGKYDVRVIHNGIDTQSFFKTESSFRQKYNLLQNKIVLGVASPWTKRKGLYDFIELSKLLPNSFSIVLVGLNKSQLSMLPKNIIGIEKTNSVLELAAIYSSADVFFNPTYEDNYPTVNIEAQACGCPVVSYKTGGSPESCPIDQVVDKGDLPSALNVILRDHFEILVRKDFSRKNMIEEYVRTYLSSDKAS